MVYFSADDYGLCPEASGHITECLKNGAINKISAFVNFDSPTAAEIRGEANFALHINLVEGKAVTKPSEIPMLADEDGQFRYTFPGLLMLSLFRKKEFEKQVRREISAQLSVWKELFPPGEPIMVDSHQHTHMIPAVFSALLEVLGDETKVSYLRIPNEPILPYLKVPSLYFTYSLKNLMKQWLLKILWQANRGKFKKRNFPTAYFFGILFSGEMDSSRVRKVLPHYIKLAEKKKRDIEVLFHPGYLCEGDTSEKTTFGKFYRSKKRKLEFDSVMDLKK